MAASYCSENNFFHTFIYLLSYFVGILVVLHIINLCGPFNKLVEKLGVDCYQYWMTYEINYRPNVPKQPRSFRCIKIHLTRLEKPDGRNNGYLQKLGAGRQFSMGSSGILAPGGCNLNPLNCVTCGFCAGDCCGHCTCMRLPPGLLEDFLYYLFNNHGFLSTMCAEKDNPYSRAERNFAFFGLGCLTFFGNLVAQIVRLSDTEGAAWDIIFIGFLNFLLTNVFEVLFSCTFLFHATDAHRNETVLHYYWRTTLSWLGSILGILLALGIGLFLLLVSSGVCGGRGENLLSFTLSSQLVGIGLDFFFILLQYVPLVIRIKGLPCIGSKTLCGGWYRERSLFHFYQRPETFFVNPAGVGSGLDQKHQYREKKGSIAGAPVYAHEVVPEVQLRSSALNSRGATTFSTEGVPPTNFCYLQINFCKVCCCSCICCPYPTCTMTRDDDEESANNVVDSNNIKNNNNRGKSAEGFSVFDIY